MAKGSTGEESAPQLLQVRRINELSTEEQSDRNRLELTIERAFYEAGKSLKEISTRRLFRSTHKTFDEYCRERFGFGRDAATLKINAAEVYDTIKRFRPDGDATVVPLPTNENQLRFIAKAHLPPEVQYEVWETATEIARGLPSGRVVKDIVEQLRTENVPPVTLQVGDVCEIVALGSPELNGKGGSWCIVTAVADFDCTVATWNEEYELKQDHLSLCPFSASEKQQMQTILSRMKKLSEKCDTEASHWILEGIAKMKRSYLTELEEKLLSLLEDEYVADDR